MTARVAGSIGDIRFTMWVLAVFGAASILLAAGTLRHPRLPRRASHREFGIPLASSSTAASILEMVVREGALLTPAGAALALAGTSP